MSLLEYAGRRVMHEGYPAADSLTPDHAELFHLWQG